MRIDARNIHRLRTPGMMGLGDAQSDAARARRQALSPMLALGPQPRIISISPSHATAGDLVTVQTDSPADGLIMFNPALPGHTVNVDSIRTNTRNAQGGSTIVFSGFKPQTQEFPWNAGTYDLRAWAITNDNYSPSPTAYTVDDYQTPNFTPPPAYIPAGVTQNAQGQYSVPGSPVWNGTSIIPPLTSPTVQPTPPGTGTQAPTGGSTTPSTQTGGGNTGTPSGGSGGFQLPSFFTDEAISGVPNWILIGVAGVALFYFGSKK